MVGLVYDFGVKPILPPTRPDREHWHRDPFSRMRAYQISCDLLDNAWPDAEMLVHHRITVKVAGQLYAAVGSIQANLAEGYSRSSGRDRARVFEYALGSIRESMVWYDASVHVLGRETVKERAQILEELRRLLLAIIPRERDRLIRPAATPKSAVGL